jgi:nitrogen-specific signal transduction histidine kinase
LAPRNLADIVDGAIALIRSQAEHLGVELHWIAPADSLLVAVDAEAFAQVVVNLLLNAVEAVAQSRHGSAFCGTPPRVIVQLASEPKAGLVCLEVMDTGPGPAVHVSEKIFEPLISDKADGAGLGLSVAREIVAQHGGTITWHRRNQLTYFKVELPVSVEEATHAVRTCR